MDESKYLIWWTTGADISSVHAHHTDAMEQNQLPFGGHLPEWLMVEVRSRAGRSGRGRLWIAPHMPDLNISKVFDPANDFHNYISQHCGGILINESDKWLIDRQAGFTTDLKLGYKPRNF